MGFFMDGGTLAVPPLEGRDVVLRHFVVGPIQTNCYAVVSGGQAMVVDPGAAGAQVAEALAGARITLVVATHGHADHVSGVRALLAACPGATFAMAAADVELASHARRDANLGITYDDDCPAPVRTLAEGDEVGVGTARFRVIETPGHTPGGIVLLGEGDAAGVAFTGDTLFAGSAGRTDFPGGDSATLMRSLDRLRSEVPADTHLFCGHGPDSTMSWELGHNPFLR